MVKRMLLVVFLGLLCNPFFCASQDSIQSVKDAKEQKELRFQQYFFKALSEKSIKNYQKAIQNLEVCDEIIPNDLSVVFEFSKNYLFLNKIKEAKEYILKALEQDPKNEWLLTHLVTIHKKDKDYNKAIEVQNKILEINPKRNDSLVSLYYLNKDFEKANALIKSIEENRGLSKALIKLKEDLNVRTKPVIQKELGENVVSLRAAFENDRTSFSLLKKLLDISFTSDKEVFHKYAELAIDLFPAQPYAYLMRGKSLGEQKKYKEGISILENGIDFVIDNPSLEIHFYDTLASQHQVVGNSSKAQEYRNKAQKIKTIK